MSPQQPRRKLCLSKNPLARPLPLELTFRTLFRTFEAILEDASRERSRGYIQTIACPTTHCCYIGFSLITTSCKLRGPFLTLRSEPQGFGFPTGRTPNDNQAPGLEGLQTMTHA